MAASEKVQDHFAEQRHWCGQLGSAFCHQMLGWMEEALKANGTLSTLVGNWPGQPTEDALSLRLLGALHHLVLTDSEPALAAHYPGGAKFGDADALRAELFAVIDRQVPHLQSFLQQAVQTNEIGRSAVLLAGFHALAACTSQPFHMYEIGASAGLNMMWDQFGYTYSNGQSWGRAESRVQLSCAVKGSAFPQPPLPAVASRQGCDVNPLDLSDPVTRLRVKSYIWPDMAERHARFDAAADMAVAQNVIPQKADAAAWVTDALANRPAAGCFVLYHSIMWQYMPQETRRAIVDAMEQAGAKATPEAPVAWIRFEPEPGSFLPELRLNFWKGSNAPINRQLAWCHPHGTEMEWLGDN